MTTHRERGRVAANGEPVTLQQAETMVIRQRPLTTASPDVLRAYHEKSAQIYRSVAELDTDHHFEALALATLARDDAAKLTNAAKPLQHTRDREE